MSADRIKRRLQVSRDTISEHLAILRRARRLYVTMVRSKIVDTFSINRAAEQMKDAGMYSAGTPLVQIRYSILRRMWRLETGGHEWHRWVQVNGWTFYTFVKQQQAA